MTTFKKLTFLFLTTTIFSMTTLVQAQSLDVDQLNLSLVDVVQEHVDRFDFLESGFITVDKSTDLSRGLLGLTFGFESTELNLLSSRIPQKIFLEGGLNIKTTDLGSVQKVDFEAVLNLKGDLLLILKHINQLFDDCANIDPQDNFQVELCLYIKTAGITTNANQLAPALESLRNALLTLISGNSPEDMMYKDLINSIIIVPGVDGVKASLLVNNLKLFGLELSGEISLDFTNTGLLLKTSGSTLLNSANYASFIAGFEKTLIGVQNKDQSALDSIYNYTYFTFELLEGIFL